MNAYFLVDQTQIIIAIIIALAIMVVSIVIYFIFSRSRGAKKIIVDIENRYKKIHELLTVQTSQEIKLIGNLSKNNVVFESIYESNRNIYDSILKREDVMAQEAIKELNDLFLDKKYKAVRLDAEQARIALNNLEEKHNRLSAAIAPIIDTHGTNKREIGEVRRLFHDVKGVFENKKGELKYIEESFEKFFSKIEDYFIDAEKLLNAAKYDEAKKNIPEIDKVLKSLSSALEVLPKLVTSCFVVIPNNVKELTERYESMIKQGYPLHHLRIINNVDQFNKKIEELKLKLHNFQLKNVDAELMKIREEILHINNELDDEINAEKYFKENYTSIYNESYQVSNRFLKLRRLIPNYKDTYLLRDTCLDTLQKVQNDISDLDRVKRMVDTFVHSPNPQPYTTLANRLEELENDTNAINNTINEMQSYLSSLKNDTESVYKYILDTYLALKNKESEIREIDIFEFSKTTVNDFKTCYELLNRACEIIKTRPIDIDSLKAIVNEVEASKNLINKKTNKSTELVKTAEEMVVRANAYRGFIDVQNDMNIVENAFFEGDFTRTIDEAGKIIKKFKSQLDE